MEISIKNITTKEQQATTLKSCLDNLEAFRVLEVSNVHNVETL